MLDIDVTRNSAQQSADTQISISYRAKPGLCCIQQRVIGYRLFGRRLFLYNFFKMCKRNNADIELFIRGFRYVGVVDDNICFYNCVY